MPALSVFPLLLIIVILGYPSWASSHLRRRKETSHLTVFVLGLTAVKLPCCLQGAVQVCVKEYRLSANSTLSIRPQQVQLRLRAFAYTWPYVQNAFSLLIQLEETPMQPSKPWPRPPWLSLLLLKASHASVLCKHRPPTPTPAVTGDTVVTRFGLHLLACFSVSPTGQ